MLAVRDVTRAYARVGAVLSDTDADWHALMDAATVLAITSHALAQTLDDAERREDCDGDTVVRPLDAMNESLQWVMRCGHGASHEEVRSRLEEAWRNAGSVLDRVRSTGHLSPVWRGRAAFRLPGDSPAP